MRKCSYCDSNSVITTLLGRSICRNCLMQAKKEISEFLHRETTERQRGGSPSIYTHTAGPDDPKPFYEE